MQGKNKRRGTKYQKNGSNSRSKRKEQYSGFINRYAFAYAGRDTANQAAKVASYIFKAATNNINKIAEQRINQVISQGGKELERILTKILLLNKELTKSSAKEGKNWSAFYQKYYVEQSRMFKEGRLWPKKN